MSTTKITVDKFFDKIAPEHLATLKVPQDKRHTFVFRLFGEKIEEWTIDMNRKKVTRGGLQNPDMYLEMNVADFLGMFNDELDVKEAILSGRIRFEGNPMLLVELGDVFGEKLN